MSTICWDCHNAGACTCEWSKDLIPVPGWIARKTHSEEYGESYRVISCPKFIRDSEGEGEVRLSDCELFKRTALPGEEEIPAPLAV